MDPAKELRARGWSQDRIDAALAANPGLIAEAKKPERDGFDSKWERLYSMHLDDAKSDHVVSQWEHHSMRFLLERSAGDGKKGAWHTPDFVVWLWDNTMEIHEVKGHMREASRVRFLVCRRLYPKIRWRMFSRTKSGWEEIL